MSSTKSTEGRLNDLEAEAFRTGRDLADIKTRIDELRAGVDARFSGIETTLAAVVSTQVEHSKALATLTASVGEQGKTLAHHGELLAEVLRRLPDKA